jgi:hypothetical protein
VTPKQQVTTPTSNFGTLQAVNPPGENPTVRAGRLTRLGGHRDPNRPTPREHPLDALPSKVGEQHRQTKIAARSTIFRDAAPPERYVTGVSRNVCQSQVSVAVDKRVIIRRYQLFNNFQLEPQPCTNIGVGDNESGKSTLLENPYWFSQDCILDYLDSGNHPQLPERTVST